MDAEPYKGAKKKSGSGQKRSKSTAKNFSLEKEAFAHLLKVKDLLLPRLTALLEPDGYKKEALEYVEKWHREYPAHFLDHSITNIISTTIIGVSCSRSARGADRG